MKHVAIDLGGKKSQVCVRSGDGAIVQERQVQTSLLGTWLQSQEHSRVVLETSSEAFAIADAAKQLGHEVRVVPGTLVKQLGVGARGIKTDRRDAQVLSEASARLDLPSVHIPSAESRQLKSLSTTREALIRSRTLLINNVRGWLRCQVIRIRTGGTRTFAKRLSEHATATGLVLPPHIVSVFPVLDALNVQIHEADARLSAIAKEDPICRRLMTVPGVGPVTAVRFRAAIDDVSRFRHAHAVGSYLGLTPGEHSSSERKHTTGITKAGSSEVRRTLIQASWVLLRSRPNEPVTQWAQRIAQRRGKFIAVVALARKLAGILFAIWRDQTHYQPQRGAATQN